MRNRVLALLISLVICGMANAESRPKNMVYLRTIDPSIEQDMRYARAHNFTGHRLDGYDAAECLLSVDTARKTVNGWAAPRRNMGLTGIRRKGGISN